jgi:hypothetical protein
MDVKRIVKRNNRNEHEKRRYSYGMVQIIEMRNIILEMLWKEKQKNSQLRLAMRKMNDTPMVNDQPLSPHFCGRT